LPQQNSTEYSPTLAEQKLIDVLLDPTNRLKSVTELCSLAGIDRGTYYNAFKKPEFADYVKQQSLELLKRAVPAGMNALLKEATRGSYPHLKMLLEMAGMYKESSEHNVTLNGFEAALKELVKRE
jgi:hypothetical protein